MFTQPAPSSTTALVTPTTDSTASPSAPPATRPSRIRGLSYLRNYTANHLLSRDSGVSAQNSASGSALGSSSQHSPLTRATTHATLSVTGRRRSRHSATADDPLSTPRDRLLRTTSAQNPGSSSSHNNGPAPEPASNSDSDSGRAKKHKTGAESVEDTEDHTAGEVNMTRTRSATTGDLSLDMLPSIRFSAHYDARSTRQSLSFTPVSRTLPTGKEIIKVGRYSEREQQQIVPANTPSAAPVGFKSKVVSRRHCEFWYEDGKWYIKDVKSSSGTFLNHIRLSPPGNESKPFIVNDGDIVQLGIDFRGGEEMIFRCVKMRIEVNRGWQNKPNNFNMATHKRLRNLTSADPANALNAQDCSICLNAIAPCQSLFVAPCSHTWHYKCIRELLVGPSHPIFTCPNCRAAADLDADIEEPDEEWQQLDSGGEDANMDTSDAPQELTTIPTDDSPNMSDMAADEAPSPVSPPVSPVEAEAEAADVTMMLDHAPTVQEIPIRPASRPEASSPVPIPRSSPIPVNRSRRTPSPPSGQEGPLTPRNDAGPWVFDGDAGRASQDISRPGAMVNLDAAAAQVESNAS
ncbi:hypothetical protein BKA67DRAFT_79336 [Truncatella angustata]|uniref:RING-type E3 ubiquitin transferase n=1 Tax=Truncatella angustata TaxID=152316 RepID=A0A9P8UZ43_9PEZI|nr:uncharacterized protein BKA67DRAFT_79336 [Truncatella angustata]KAH6661241.1 hypothetical protein BKA67DRAFT_79336 [Truncatella angustata]